VVIPAFTVAPVLILLHRAYGIGVAASAEHPDPLAAPQASLFASLAEGFFKDGAIPWSMVIIGLGLGVLLVVANEVLMQFQADMLNVPVIRPKVTETTALGAAYAAGLAVGFWSGQDELRQNWAEDKTWQPSMAETDREKYYRDWKKAVDRTFNWVE
jgi:uncharacterized oligopeptide transporter (OPT) family protein